MSVSVIIAVWNRPHLLKRAVHSVLQQTMMPLELLVVDDGSSDDTISEIMRFEKEATPFPIRGIYMSHCGMVGAVRNRGIREAKGEWIAFLDSDDEWMPQKLSLQMEEVKKGGRSWCHTREQWIRNGKEISQKTHTHKREGILFEDALKKCIIGPSTVLLHRSLFDTYGMFNEELEIAEDYELWMRMTHREPISYIDIPLVIKYAGHGNQLSEKYGYIEKFRIDAMEYALKSTLYTRQETQTIRKELRHKQWVWQQGEKKREKGIV